MQNYKRDCARIMISPCFISGHSNGYVQIYSTYGNDFPLLSNNTLNVLMFYWSPLFKLRNLYCARCNSKIRSISIPIIPISRAWISNSLIILARGLKINIVSRAIISRLFEFLWEWIVFRSLHHRNPLYNIICSKLSIYIKYSNNFTSHYAYNRSMFEVLEFTILIFQCQSVQHLRD